MLSCIVLTERRYAAQIRGEVAAELAKTVPTQLGVCSGASGKVYRMHRTRTRVICRWCGEERFTDQCVREDELRNSCQSGALFQDSSLGLGFRPVRCDHAAPDQQRVRLRSSTDLAAEGSRLQWRTHRLALRQALPRGAARKSRAFLRKLLYLVTADIRLWGWCCARG